jgi:hypothetical protein
MPPIPLLDKENDDNVIPFTDNEVLNPNEILVQPFNFLSIAPKPNLNTIYEPEINEIQRFTDIPNLYKKENKYENLLNKISTNEIKERFYNPNPDKADLDYALYSKDVYNDKRTDILNRKYNKEYSSNKYGTYIGDDDIVLAIKGTTPDFNLQDLKVNTGLLLGSFGGQLNTALTNYPIQEQLNKLKKDFPSKQITITGHSQAGALASLLGIDNPDINAVTFNRELGIPFISSVVKCTIFGCKNIKNYRTAGDFASASLFSNPQSGKTFTLAPKIPDPITQLEAQSMESYFIPADLYIPHSVNNFIDRSKDNLAPDHNIFGRTLSRRTGAAAGIIGSLVAPTIFKSAGNFAKDFYSKLPNTKNKATGKIIEKVLDLGTQGLIDEDDFNLFSPENQRFVEISLAEDKISPIVNTVGEIGTGLSTINQAISGIVGGGIGSVAGVAVYDSFIAGRVEDI